LLELSFLLDEIKTVAVFVIDAYLLKNSIHLHFLVKSKLCQMENLSLFILVLCSCFTTEVLEGFDVQRTSGLGDTLRKYGHLTQAIFQYYKSEFFEDNNKCSAICPPYDEFVRRCQDLEKMTVSDVFAIQLMQVPIILKLILNMFSCNFFICFS
jgi:hypothetical protein